jgi:hypothetical protein|tara:strand:+ start:487 stop:957 length:471 start_codon:yes stop_codon:yes gene_type:complete
MATLTTTIKEELTLNGIERGSTNTLSITGVSEVMQRMVTCPANNDTTIASFKAAVNTSDGALELASAKYIRVTNLDSSNSITLSLQISSAENGTADASTSILLAAGRSFIMGTPHDGIATDDDGTTVITDSNLNDLESLIVDPMTNSVTVELFIAS